jgi:hypothetical protein
MDNAPKFELIGFDDGVITFIEQFVPVHRPAPLLVAVTFLD